MKLLKWGISDRGIHYSKNSRPVYILTRRAGDVRHALWDVARGEGNIIATVETCVKAKTIAEDDAKTNAETPGPYAPRVYRVNP